VAEASDAIELRSGPSWSDVGLGLGVVALAGVLAWQVMSIPASPLYARVGPSLFPWIAVSMLGLLGLALSVQGFRGGWAHDEASGTFDLRGCLYMSLGLLANLLFIDGMQVGVEPAVIPFPKLGFIIASTIQFVLIARAFESERPLRDIAIGFGVAVLAYIGFDQLLGYRIGSGLVEDVIQAGFARFSGAR
jgi:putative tricarboxylic transport membrane protein